MRSLKSELAKLKQRNAKTDAPVEGNACSIAIWILIFWIQFEERVRASARFF